MGAYRLQSSMQRSFTTNKANGTALLTNAPLTGRNVIRHLDKVPSHHRLGVPHRREAQPSHSSNWVPLYDSNNPLGDLAANFAEKPKEVFVFNIIPSHDADALNNPLTICKQNAPCAELFRLHHLLYKSSKVLVTDVLLSECRQTMPAYKIARLGILVVWRDTRCSSSSSSQQHGEQQWNSQVMYQKDWTCAKLRDVLLDATIPSRKNHSKNNSNNSKRNAKTSNNNSNHRNNHDNYREGRRERSLSPVKPTNVGFRPPRDGDSRLIGLLCTTFPVSIYDHDHRQYEPPRRLRGNPSPVQLRHSSSSVVGTNYGGENINTLMYELDMAQDQHDDEAEQQPFLIQRPAFVRFTYYQGVLYEGAHYVPFLQRLITPSIITAEDRQQFDNYLRSKQPRYDDEQPIFTKTTNSECLHFIVDLGRLTYLALRLALGDTSHHYAATHVIARSISFACQGTKDSNSGVVFHLVADGMPTAQKADTAERGRYTQREFDFGAGGKFWLPDRSPSRLNLFQVLARSIALLNNECFNADGSQTAEGKRIFKDNPNIRGIQYYQAAHEADDHVARLCTKFHHPHLGSHAIIVSNDHDMIYKSPSSEFIINKFMYQKLSSLVGPDYAAESRGIIPAAYRRSLGMSHIDFLSFIAVCGSDYFIGLVAGGCARQLLTSSLQDQNIQHISSFSHLHHFVEKCVKQSLPLGTPEEQKKLFQDFYRGLYYCMHLIVYDEKTKHVISQVPMEYKVLNDSILEFKFSSQVDDQTEQLRKIVETSFALNPNDKHRVEGWWNKTIIRKLENGEESNTTAAELYCTMETSFPPLAGNPYAGELDTKEFDARVSKTIEILKQHFGTPSDWTTRVVACVASQLRQTRNVCPNSGSWCQNEAAPYFEPIRTQFLQLGQIDEETTLNIESVLADWCASSNPDKYKDDKKEVEDWLQKQKVNIDASVSTEDVKNIKKFSPFLSCTALCWVAQRLSKEITSPPSSSSAEEEEEEEVSPDDRIKVYKEWLERLSKIMQEFASSLEEIRETSNCDNWVVACTMIDSGQIDERIMKACETFLLYDHYLHRHFELRGEPDLTTFSGQFKLIFETIRDSIDSKKIQVMCGRSLLAELANFTKWKCLCQVLQKGVRGDIEKVISTFEDGLAEPGDVVPCDVSSCCPGCHVGKERRCSICRLLKEIIIEYVWFSNLEERKVRRERFEHVVLKAKLVAGYRLRFPSNFNGKSEQRRMLAETLPCYTYILKLEQLVGAVNQSDPAKRCCWVDNVLLCGLVWWGKIIDVANETILGNGMRTTTKARSSYRVLKRLLIYGVTGDEQIRRLDSADQSAFHKKQLNFFNFITKYPHLWRKYVFAQVICANFGEEPITVGKFGKIFHHTFDRGSWSKSMYFCVNENDWNCEEANEEFEQLLIDSSNDEKNNMTEYETSFTELGQYFDKFTRLSHVLPENHTINNNYPGTKSGDFLFLIQMMIISLKRNSKTVDGEHSMRDDDDSDLHYEYPREFITDAKLGSKKKEYYAQMKANIETGPPSERCRCPLICKQIDNNQEIADYVRNVRANVQKRIESGKKTKEEERKEKLRVQKAKAYEKSIKDKGRSRQSCKGWTQDEKNRLFLLRQKLKKGNRKFFWHEWEMPKFDANNNNEPIIPEGWHRCTHEFKTRNRLRSHMTKQYFPYTYAKKVITMTKEQKAARMEDIKIMCPSRLKLNYFHCKDCGDYEVNSAIKSASNHLNHCPGKKSPIKKQSNKKSEKKVVPKKKVAKKKKNSFESKKKAGKKIAKKGTKKASK